MDYRSSLMRTAKFEKDAIVIIGWRIIPKSSGTGKVSQLVMMGLDLRKGEDANLNPNYSIKNEPRAPVRL